MALTWRNVDAPNMAGVGSLMGAATDSFNSAMGNLQKMSDRAAAQRRAGYSAQMLQQLAAVDDPTKVGEFIQGFDASQLSPEALAVAMQQPGVLLGRQQKQVELDNARGDLAYEQDSRAGALQAAGVRAEAARLAATGDADGAAQLLGSLEGYGAVSALDDFGNINPYATGYQNRRETELDFGRKVDQQNYSDTARDILYTDIADQAHNPNEAKLLANQMSAGDPRLREALHKQIDSMGEESFGLIDPNMPDAFQTNPDLGVAHEELQFDADYINRDIGTQLSSTPLARFDGYLKSIQEHRDDPSGGSQDVADWLANNQNIIAKGWIPWSNGQINQTIDNVKQKLASEGVTATREEVAAAMAETAETSGLAWSDGLRINDEKAVMGLVKDTKDPAKMRPEQRRISELNKAQETLENYSQQIENKNREYMVAQTNGQTARASRALEDMNKLIQQQQDFNSKYIGSRTPEGTNNSNTNSNSHPTAPTDEEVASILSSVTGGGRVAGPSSGTYTGGAADAIIPPVPRVNTAADSQFIPFRTRPINPINPIDDILSRWGR